MNRKILFHQTGNSQVLKLSEEKTPMPSQGEVVVAMKAVGLNRADNLFHNGFYLVTPRFPSSLGIEGSGIVHDTGKDVTEFRKGEPVSILPSFDLRKYGVLGDYALVPAGSLMKLPDTFSMVEGASVWVPYFTAYAGLVLKGNLKRRNAPVVVISAASSPVGLAAIQIAKRYNATVIATTRTSDKKSFLFENGADYMIATTDENVVEEIMKITNNKGFDIALDAIAGPFVNQLAIAAAPEASIVIYGALSMEETPYPLIQATVKGLNISSLHVNVNLLKHPDRLGEAKSDIISGFRDGIYYQKTDKSFSFENFREAFEYLEKGNLKGKIIIENFHTPEL